MKKFTMGNFVAIAMLIMCILELTFGNYIYAGIYFLASLCDFYYMGKSSELLSNYWTTITLACVFISVATKQIVLQEYVTASCLYFIAICFLDKFRLVKEIESLANNNVSTGTDSK